MSTRSEIRFATREDGVSFSEHPEKINAQFYAHYDGYPENRGVEISGMDDENVFGKVFYSLPFGEAIKRKLLTDYQVVIVGVDKPMIAEWIKNRELVESPSKKNTNADIK